MMRIFRIVRISVDLFVKGNDPKDTNPDKAKDDGSRQPKLN